MSMPPNDLLKWTKKIKTEVSEDGGVSRVELWHAIEGEGGDRISTFKNLGEHAPEDLAEAIWEAAEGDAKTRTAGMPQRYSAQAFVESDDSDGMPEHMHPFVLKGGQAGDLFGDDTEPSTPAGQTKQNMRHTENLHRLLVQQTEFTAGRLARDYAEERKARIEAENRSLNILELHQKLLDRQNEREIEQAKAIMSEKRTDAVLGLMMTMAPLIVAKFMPAMLGAPMPGIPPAPGAPPQAGIMGPLLTGSPRSIKLGQILLSIPRDRAGELLSSLSQMTQLAVMQLVASYQSSPPGADKTQDDMRDVAIMQLLKSISQDELMAILMVLDKEQQREFLAVYKSYSAEEARNDAERPEVLKTTPTERKHQNGEGKEEALS